MPAVYIPGSAGRRLVHLTIAACWEMVFSEPMMRECFAVLHRFGRSGRSWRQRFQQLSTLPGKTRWEAPSEASDCPLRSEGDRRVAETAVSGSASYIFARNRKDFQRREFRDWCEQRGIIPLEIGPAVELLAKEPARFTLPDGLDWLFAPQ